MTTRYTHIRAKTQNEYGDSIISTKGGGTIAWQYEDDKQRIAYAIAACSKRDNFCRRTGRAVASGRLAADKDVHYVDYSNVTGDPIISPSYKQMNEFFFNSYYYGD